VQSLPLRRLVVGPPPARERVFYHNLWLGTSENARYSELLPRLRRLDPFLVALPESRLLRAGAFRLLGATRGAHERAIFAAAARRYRAMLATATRQAALFRGRVVVDVDDPTFTDEEARLLRLPNVTACVVTAESAVRRLHELGVDKPIHVVPQGVDLAAITPGAVEEVASRHRRNGEVVVGYVSSWLLTAGDRGGNRPNYNVDHLLELWESIRARVPHARLWLLGGPSASVARRLRGRDDILLFGRVPRERLLAYVSNFDVALYPRAADRGVRAVKIAEYMGAGVATVSYDYEVTADLRSAGAGLLVRSPTEFVDAVARLASDDAERLRLARAAAAAGRTRDWDVLARTYEQILDRHLPRA
jgi:glycosyltransferase involved in cell wall biosynthesis